ncbi:MAG: SURF1 family protein [Pseudomonadota bacterium]
MNDDARSHRPRWIDLTILAAAIAVFVTLISLGNWQMRRLEWKLTLIEAVETRAYGDAVGLPVGEIDADRHAYLRVAVEGTYRHDLTQRVKAITELGGGHWVLTPLMSPIGPVWVNRGFVPSGLRPAMWTKPEGIVAVEGLLRISEPQGTLLERNDPDAGRWVSRDVLALSLDAGLADALPFFIDADHASTATAWPRGGLTVLTFRNNHLQYAMTWYAMATLFAAGMAYVVRDRLRAEHETV